MSTEQRDQAQKTPDWEGACIERSPLEKLYLAEIYLPKTSDQETLRLKCIVDMFPGQRPNIRIPIAPGLDASRMSWAPETRVALSNLKTANIETVFGEKDFLEAVSKIIGVEDLRGKGCQIGYSSVASRHGEAGDLKTAKFDIFMSAGKRGLDIAELPEILERQFGLRIEPKRISDWEKESRDSGLGNYNPYLRSYRKNQA